MSKRQRHIHVNSNEHVVVHCHDRRRSQAPPAAPAPADSTVLTLDQILLWGLGVGGGVIVLGWLVVTLWPILCGVAVVGVLLLLHKAGICSAIPKFWDNLMGPDHQKSRRRRRRR